MKFTARVGRTRYELEETKTPRILKITRFNSDGEKEFFVPKDIFIEYLAHKMGPVLTGMAEDAIRKALND